MGIGRSSCFSAKYTATASSGSTDMAHWGCAAACNDTCIYDIDVHEFDINTYIMYIDAFIYIYI